MTVIVHSNKQLAFDKRLTEDTMLVGKVVKGKIGNIGTVAAACGEMQDVQAFLDWFDSGLDLADREKFGLTSAGEFQGILVIGRTDGKFNHLSKGVYLVDNKVYPYKVESKHIVLGSGGAYALGALHMGATAEEAAKIAIKCDVACGDGVTVYET